MAGLRGQYQLHHCRLPDIRRRALIVDLISCPPNAKLDGVRRALIAYWAEGLTGLNERGALTMFSRFHNWNAVAEIRDRLIGMA